MIIGATRKLIARSFHKATKFFGNIFRISFARTEAMYDVSKENEGYELILALKRVGSSTPKSRFDLCHVLPNRVEVRMGLAWI